MTEQEHSAAAAPRERPIIFSGPMVRSILAGTKTQTRRAMTVQPMFAADTRDVMWRFVGGLRGEWNAWSESEAASACGWVCPYGAPGDRLWVRETWRIWESESFAGNGEPLDPDVFTGQLAACSDEFLRSRPLEFRADSLDEGPWRPAIFMPRWASRLLLEVVEISAQRVQEISLDDARAEGIPQTGSEAHALGLQYMDREPGHEWDNRTSVENFARLWDSINGKRRVPTARWQAIPGPRTDIDTSHSWAGNPWVWVITFKRIEATT